MIALLVGGGYLAKPWLFPQGSDNMLVATDGTPVLAIVVTSGAGPNGPGETIWRICSPTGRSAEDLGYVPYGSVPAGFRQEIPASGPPRAFLEGERLDVHVLSATMDVADGGQAGGPQEFRTQVWYSGPIDRLSPECASGLEPAG